MREYLREAALYLIGVVLVAGFWWHGNFYQLGFWPLLLLGGAAVYIVMKVAQWATGDYGLARRPPDGYIVVSADETGPIRSETKTAVVRPARKGRIRPGKVYDARLHVASRKPFAKLAVTDVYRKRVADVTEAEARADGAVSLYEWRKRWKERWGDTDLVRVARFRAVRFY